VFIPSANNTEFNIEQFGASIFERLSKNWQQKVFSCNDPKYLMLPIKSSGLSMPNP
jgi:hypothetical protein